MDARLKMKTAKVRKKKLVDNDGRDGIRGREGLTTSGPGQRIRTKNRDPPAKESKPRQLT